MRSAPGPRWDLGSVVKKPHGSFFFPMLRSASENVNTERKKRPGPKPPIRSTVFPPKTTRITATCFFSGMSFSPRYTNRDLLFPAVWKRSAKNATLPCLLWIFVTGEIFFLNWNGWIPHGIRSYPVFKMHLGFLFRRRSFRLRSPPGFLHIFFSAIFLAPRTMTFLRKESSSASSAHFFSAHFFPPG